MLAFLRLFYRSVKKRSEREKQKPGACRQPSKRASLSELAKNVSSELMRESSSFTTNRVRSNPMTSFCFGLSTIEESYLLFVMVSQ